MDEQTIQFYEREAVKLAASYDLCDGGISGYFNTAFTSGMRILEIGCGTGRDLSRLVKMGFDAEGVEPCRAFREHAVSKYPCLRECVSHDHLPELDTVEPGAFDGVLCSGVLMHLPEEQVFDAVYAIRRVLRADGRLLISVPCKDGLAEGKVRDHGGRLFNRMLPEKWQLIFERIGFTLISRWHGSDGLKRKERTWTTLLFTLAHSDQGRPLDKIEAVLNRDTKVATYKLALFRALAELAQTSNNLARWRFDGKVLIPLEAVAEKWIAYFWPIVAHADATIPQTTGRPIAFRSLLSELIAMYSSKQGGLAGFSIDFRSQQMSKEADAVCRKLMSKLKSTIWNQPVRYAGGGDDFSVFQYNKKDKCLAMDADMWRELSLTGCWIQDATILRWAELTSKISNGEVKPSTVIDLLLTTPLPERDTHAAKHIYDRLDSKACVWTERRIVDDYDVDHAIPFSLWHNNDLWNLLPANRQVNSQKRDRLPSRRLIKQRRDALVYYWEVMQAAFPIRFDHEMGYLCGTGTEGRAGWQGRLFSAFSEAVEVTACRRGTERWEP
jgi:SAM-dependent methyltransferase